MKECEDCGQALENCTRCGGLFCPACEGECIECITPEEGRRSFERTFAIVLSSFPTNEFGRQEANHMVDNLRKNKGYFENESNSEVIARLAPHLA